LTKKALAAMAPAFDRAYQAGDLASMVALARTAFAAQMFIGALDEDRGSLVDMLLEDDERRDLLTGDAWDYH
jgi:hypothetical protein